MKYWTAWWKRASRRWCRRRPNYSRPWSQAWRFPDIWDASARRWSRSSPITAAPARRLIDDLNSLYSEGQGGRGTLDFLRIVSEPSQTAAEYRRMLSEVKQEYLEFSRPPYAVDPLDEKLVKQARASGVNCRLLLEAGSLDEEHRSPLERLRGRGRGSPHGGIAAHEAGGVRLPRRDDRPARPRDHAACLDCRGLSPRRNGRGHERVVRRSLAEGKGVLTQPCRFFTGRGRLFFSNGLRPLSHAACA